MTQGWVVHGVRRHAEPLGDNDPPQLMYDTQQHSLFSLSKRHGYTCPFWFRKHPLILSTRRFSLHFAQGLPTLLTTLPFVVPVAIENTTGRVRKKNTWRELRVCVFEVRNLA